MIQDGGYAEAFVLNSATAKYYGASGGTYLFTHANFSASKCSAVYGASSTVTPPSVKCAFLIKHD